MERPTNPVFNKTIYLSGPMSGMPDLNREAFERAEARCYELGARFVLNPREFWGHTDRAPEWYMRRDLHLLTNPGGGDGEGVAFDALLALPGYRMSRGAMAEVMCAELSGIEVVRYSDLLGVSA